MFVESYHGGRMGYAFTDARAVSDAVTDARAGSDARAVTSGRRPANAPHPGRPIRRHP
jgi:hypothetical protein